jgi:hypothetical protein
VGLTLMISRHEVPLRQFAGGVDPAGYIWDQWWPHPESLALLLAGPGLLWACWAWGRQRRAQLASWVLAAAVLAGCAVLFTNIPATSLPTAATNFGLLATENVNQLIPALAAAFITLACLGGWARSGEARLVAWLATFGMAMFFLQYPRMDEPHLIFSFPPMMAALAWFLSRAETRIIGGFTRQPRLVLRTAVYVALVAVPMLSLFPASNWRWSMLMPPRPSWETPQPHIYVPMANARARILALPYLAQSLDSVAEEIQSRTADGEPIFVFPASPMIYYLTDRPNATRNNHFLPGLVSGEEEQRVIRQIQERAVRVVVIEPAFEIQWLRDTDYAQLRSFLRTDFELSTQIGPYEIWTRGA